MQVYLAEDKEGDVKATFNSKVIVIPKRLTGDLRQAIKLNAGQRARLHKGQFVPVNVSLDLFKQFATLDKMFRGLIGG